MSPGLSASICLRRTFYFSVLPASSYFPLLVLLFFCLHPETFVALPVRLHRRAGVRNGRRTVEADPLHNRVDPPGGKAMVSARVKSRLRMSSGHGTRRGKAQLEKSEKSENAIRRSLHVPPYSNTMEAGRLPHPVFSIIRIPSLSSVPHCFFDFF